MKSVTIIGEKRSATGKAATKLVRNAGQVPSLTNQIGTAVPLRVVKTGCMEDSRGEGAL